MRSLAVLLITAAVCSAQSKKAPGKAEQPNPAYRVVEDVPGLPRALIIGDSISMGYTEPVRKLLEGKFNVHRIPTNGGPTIRGIEQLESWITAPKQWDLIHFNFGLHDLRQDAAGKRQVPLGDYEKNLRQITARLKKTGAKLVWASTTPVPEGKVEPPRSDADVVAYNAVARRVMEEHGVSMLDLYSLALPRLGAIQRPVNVHFTDAGSYELAGHVAAVWKKLVSSGR